MPFLPNPIRPAALLSPPPLQIDLIDTEDIRPLLDELAPAIAAHHARALNANHPHQRGTAQGPDVYMQALEAANPFHHVSAPAAGVGWQ